MEPLSTSLCRSCRNRLKKSHPSLSFSTTTHRRVIPPESPNYINVPHSLQMGFHYPQRVKGILPTPKDIFHRSGPDKSDPQYVARLTRDPKPENLPKILDNELSEQQRYKARMTQLRKQHIREGLAELHNRKQKQDNDMKIRSDTKSAERARLISQAEREDARLTNVSVPSAMNPNLPQRFSQTEIEKMQRRKQFLVEKHGNRKIQRRQDSLHTLYMNARNFITSEEQLLEKIKEEFDEKDFGGHISDPAKSYWDSQGPPDGIAQMVNRSTMGRDRRGVGEKEDAWRRDQERMKRLAEELSGGKM